MSIESTTQRQWLEDRNEHYSTLFGEENMNAGSPAEVSEAPLVCLAMHTYLRGRYSSEEQVINGQISESVDAILRHHDEASKNDGPAIFSVIKTEHLSRLSEITTQTILLWGRACRRNRIDSPFGALPLSGSVHEEVFARKDVQLVIETAAAALQVMQNGYAASTERKLAGVLAKKGPEYMGAWMRGDDIKHYCETNDLDAERWLSCITPSLRVRVAMDYANPVAWFADTVSTVDKTLDTENLMREFDWTKSQVEAVFCAQHPHEFGNV